MLVCSFFSSVWQTLIDGMIDTHLYLCKFTVVWPWATGINIIPILYLYNIHIYVLLNTLAIRELMQRAALACPIGFQVAAVQLINTTSND